MTPLFHEFGFQETKSSEIDHTISFCNVDHVVGLPTVVVDKELTLKLLQLGRSSKPTHPSTEIISMGGRYSIDDRHLQLLPASMIRNQPPTRRTLSGCCSTVERV